MFGATVAYRRPAPTRIPAFVIVLVVIGVGAFAVMPAPRPSSSSTSSGPTVEGVPLDAPAVGGRVLLRREGDVLGLADGAVPAGTTASDVAVPGVAKLDADLLAALRRASADAADGGVRIVIDSGWRSRDYQAHLLQQAIAKYGSEEAALRWVATPDSSAHVSGDAVDVGPASATAWLSDHGASYGLCQIYRNEPWHYELRADAPRRGCPRMYADASDDPRMRRT